MPRNLAAAALPHYSGAISAARGMWMMSALLLPLLIWGVLIFGLYSLAVVILAVFSTLAGELLGMIFTRRSSFTIQLYIDELSNGSAVLAGLLLGLILPVTVSPFIPLIAGLFGMVVVKWSFGGLGANWLNPALAGTLFAGLSWPGGMHAREWGAALISGLNWNPPSGSLTDMARLKMSLIQDGSPRIFRPMEMIGREFTNADSFISRFLNEQILLSGGTRLPGGYIDYILGFKLEGIGQTSILLILLVSVFLFARGIISWQIPTGGVLALSVLTGLFSGVNWGGDFFSGDVLFALSSGGFLFILFFMATDPVTTPYTSGGKLIFGVGVGVLVFLFREFSLLPDGSVLAVLIMNMLNPVIIILTRPKPFGFERRAVK